MHYHPVNLTINGCFEFSGGLDKVVMCIFDEPLMLLNAQSMMIGHSRW